MALAQQDPSAETLELRLYRRRRRRDKELQQLHVVNRAALKALMDTHNQVIDGLIEQLAALGVTDIPGANFLGGS